MENFGLINVSEVSKLLPVLTGGELKLLLFILYYLSSNDKQVYINNKQTRELLAEVGFDRAPQRISNLLSSLVSKGVLVREAQAVFSVPKTLYLPSEGIKNNP